MINLSLICDLIQACFYFLALFLGITAGLFLYAIKTQKEVDHAPDRNTPND